MYKWIKFKYKNASIFFEIGFKWVIKNGDWEITKEFITKQAINGKVQCYNEVVDLKSDSPEYAIFRYK